MKRIPRQNAFLQQQQQQQHVFENQQNVFENQQNVFEKQQPLFGKQQNEQSCVQPWPSNLPPCGPTNRIGLTDPLIPHAAHPARFQQLQQQRTAQAVYNPNDPGGQASLMSLAAQEQARRKLFASVSQSCSGGLHHILVTLNSSQADAARILTQNTRNGDDSQESYESITFDVSLESAMTDLLAHRLIYGQIKSWETELLLRCSRDPTRATAIITAPVNHEPIFGQDRYTLPISELLDVTCERQTVHLDVKGSSCPSIVLPLTLAQVIRIIAFRFPLEARSHTSRAYDKEDDIMPLYGFKTREAHGFVPGLAFTLALRNGPKETWYSDHTDIKDSPFLPRNGDRFVVIDTLSHQSHSTGVGLDCFEFVALRCNRQPCAARDARVFDPWDQCVEPQKYGWQGPRITLELPPACGSFLRHGNPALMATNYSNEDSEKSDDNSDREDNDLEEELALAFQETYLAVDLTDEFAFAYVSPPTTPDQLVCLVNGTLRAQKHCGFNAFDQLGVLVGYDPLIDQYIVSNSLGQCTPKRSLFGDQCDTATTFNFPLSRKAMVASECSFEAKQVYLERVVSGFYFFDVRYEENDRFLVNLECGSEEDTAVHEIIIEPACYAARFFVAAVESALNDSFGEPNLFQVRYELFDTEKLVEARIKYEKRNVIVRPTATYIGPYRNLTFAIVIQTCDPKRIFSLHFDKSVEARQFAALIDFDPRQYYELRSLYSSRSLSLGCIDEFTQRQWLNSAKKCSVDCAPCPRRKYEAQVDQACGLVTLQQRIQRPYYVKKLTDFDDHCALRVQIVDAEKIHPTVMFCAGDVLIASKCNPLCAAENCNPDETLVVIVGEQSFDTFDLNFDPFPGSNWFWLWAMPVGFNLHLHRNESPNLSTFNYFDTEKSQAPKAVSQSNAVTRFLGFICPSTRTSSFCYTSDQVPASILDENLLIQVRELLPLASGQGRNTLYTPQSPFNNYMTEYYAQLLLDRGVGQYRAFPALTSPLPSLSAPANILPAPGAGNIECLKTMTIQLFRPDGSVYLMNGNAFTLTFELIFVRK